MCRVGTPRVANALDLGKQSALFSHVGSGISEKGVKLRTQSTDDEGYEEPGLVLEHLPCVKEGCSEE